MDVDALRAQFPVLEHTAYLNSGTDGPMPAAAAAAAREELDAEVGDGRVRAHFERRFELQRRLREAYARVANADPARDRADHVGQRRAGARDRRARARRRTTRSSRPTRSIPG